MKKLNNKGFTLIELLAVIVILAIVVAITIPAVLTTINTSKKKAFETSISTVADWFERQYQAYLMGDSSVATVDGSFTSACIDGSSIKCTESSAKTLSDTEMKSAGVDPGNYDSITVYIDTTTGRACVVGKSNPSGNFGEQADSKSATCPDDIRDIPNIP